MQALHLTADLYRCTCDSAWLTDPERLRAWALRGVAASAAEGGELFLPSAGGVVGAVLMPRWQLNVRTWPGDRSVALDVCVAAVDEQSRREARAMMDALLGLFAPEWTEQRSLDRGDES